jgi:hypothetical protein
MSTLFVAAILVGTVAAVCYLLVSLDKKQKRIAMNKLLHTFHLIGSQHNLRFSSQEVLKDAVIGLDGVNRKLLLLERAADGAVHSHVLDLADVKSCTVKKEYGAINGGDLKAKKLEQYLHRITLQFLLLGKPAVEFVFYKHVDNHINEMAELEHKAKHWEAILSKMVAPVKKIA